MAISAEYKKFFGDAAESVFDHFMDSDATLKITTEKSFNPQTYADSGGDSYLVRGMITPVSINKIDNENIKTGDCIAMILAKELPIIPDAGMTVQDAIESPLTATGDGREYLIYAVETDAANAVHTLYLRRV